MTRADVYAAIDDERGYQDAKNPKTLALGEELALALKYALQAQDGRSDEVYPISGSRTLEELRKLAAVCVRALEHHGPPVRAMCGPIGFKLRDYVPGTREETYAAIDSEIAYQDDKSAWTFELDEAADKAVVGALQALRHWSNQPSDHSELMARVLLRHLGAICVRALERHGAQLREPDPLPPPPTYRDGWKAGKNAHVIAFVDEAERTGFKTVSIGNWADLRDRITALTTGQATLDAPQTVQEWYAQFRNRPH